MTPTTLVTQFVVPDIANYTSDFFSCKCNPYLSEGEVGAHAWFDSYGIPTTHCWFAQATYHSQSQEYTWVANVKNSSNPGSAFLLLYLIQMQTWSIFVQGWILFYGRSQ
jgi:hypothetical protein